MPRKGTWIPVNLENSKKFCEYLNLLEEDQHKITEIDVEFTSNRRAEGVIRLDGHHDYIFGKWVGIGKEPPKKEEKTEEPT